MPLRRILVYSALSIFFMTTHAEAGPSIIFSAKSVDLGKINYGIKKKVEFAFTNTGDETLVIRKLRSSCGCTQVVEGKQEIPPGGSSKIAVTLDTNMVKPGNRRKSLYVHSNDSEKPIVRLLLFANVVRRIKVEPKSLTLMLHKFQEEVEFHVKMSNETKNAITVQGVQASGSAVDAYIKPDEIVVQPGMKGPFVIGLKLSNEDKWPIYQGTVKLKVSDPVEKKVNLRYFIQIKKIK